MSSEYRIEWIGTFSPPVRTDIYTMRPCKSKSKKWAKRRAKKCVRRILDASRHVMNDNYDLCAKAIAARACP